MAACGTRAACNGFGIARNTATTFDIFLWLQVTNVDVSLLHSALARDVQPNRKQVCCFLRIHNFCVRCVWRMSLIALRFGILCKSCENVNLILFRHIQNREHFVVANAIGYAERRSRSHDAVIRVYDDAGNVIETHEHAGDFKEW